MKIAISSQSEDINGDISDVFGRCPYFIIVEIEGKKIIKTEAIKNESVDQMSGAGVSAAQMIAEKNVDAIISKNMGPRAMDVLNQFNITFYKEEGSIKEAIQKIIDKPN